MCESFNLSSYQLINVQLINVFINLSTFYWIKSLTGFSLPMRTM